MSRSWEPRRVQRAVVTILAMGLAVSLAAILPATAGATAPAGSAQTAAEPTDEQLANDEAPLPKRCGKPPLMGCRLTWHGADAPTLIVWGDSHMWMMTPAVKEAIGDRKVNVLLYFLGGCIPAIPDKKIYAGNDCAEVSYAAMRHLQQLEASGRRYRLLLGAFWGANLDRVYWYENQERANIMKERRIFTQRYTRPLFPWLGQNNIPTDVSLQGPISVPPSDCGLGTWPFWCPVSRHRAYYKDAYTRTWLSRRMAHLDRGSRLVDYSNGICSKTSCPAVVNGIHTWFDPYHVSATKAERLARFYRPTIKALLQSR